MDEHNIANLGWTVGESVASIAEIAGRAAADGVRLSAYVSAAFGYRHEGRFVPVADEQLADQVRRLFDLGACMVTLSDLQGLADPHETARVWDRVLGLDGGAHAGQLGYHPHHVDPHQAVERVEAAYGVGVRCFDASLRAAGGCITGAPGNAPTEQVLRRLHRLGARTGIDEAAVAGLEPAWL
jgi:isopropylmalate/homocitrate/citramalate synthase